VLRVAIVGCGKIADAHAAQIRRIPGCEIVAACDREELMARQLCERFSVARWFNEVEELLSASSPDVVHITTPPQSHFTVGMTCLDAGCHVFIEKPFTVSTLEAAALIDLAQLRNLNVTVGHDDQFSHVARRMRRLVRAGYLGGPPVHMESCYCYDLTEPTYAKAFLSNKSHWVHGLPGKLFQNIASHGLARIAEFFPDDHFHVTARKYASPRVRGIAGEGIFDELRVLIDGTHGCTAYFTFSSQMRPLLHQFRLFGPGNGVILDEDHQTLIQCRGKSYKSYAEKFIPPASAAWQNIQNLAFNARKFLANDFHMKNGMKSLIECFYESVVHGAPLPITYREILLTSRLMDAIVEQIYGRDCPSVSAQSATVA